MEGRRAGSSYHWWWQGNDSSIEKVAFTAGESSALRSLLLTLPCPEKWLRKIKVLPTSLISIWHSLKMTVIWSVYANLKALWGMRFASPFSASHCPTCLWHCSPEREQESLDLHLSPPHVLLTGDWEVAGWDEVVAAFREDSEKYVISRVTCSWFP